MSEATNLFAAATATLRDGLASVCRLYGINPLAGRLYAILFLAPEALSLDELAAEVRAAKSSVSVALRKLLAARVVRRLPPRGGDRRDFYEVVDDPWAMLADWHRFYFQPELEMWRQSGDALERALRDGADAPPPEARAILNDRLNRLREFAELTAQLLGQLAGARVAPAPARTITIQVDPE